MPASMTQRPDDVCPCGSEAATATGNPMIDHASTCSVYMAEHYRRALVNLAEWGDGASIESARAYARAAIRAAKGEN